MKQCYSAAQKAAIMTQLERNGGNVQLTSQQTGVPDRTLYGWQRDMLPLLQQFAPAASRSTETEIPKFESDFDALAFIRQNILGELSRLSASLKDDPGFSTPYQRALVLSQLMDKLLKLDLHLKPYTKVDNEVEIEEIVLMYEGENWNGHDKQSKIRLFPGEERLDELDRQRAANLNYDDEDAYYPSD